MWLLIIVTFSAVLDIGTFSATLHTTFISRQNENIHFQKENTYKLTLLQDRCAAFYSAVFDTMSSIMHKQELRSATLKIMEWIGVFENSYAI